MRTMLLGAIFGAIFTLLWLALRGRENDDERSRDAQAHAKKIEKNISSLGFGSPFQDADAHIKAGEYDRAAEIIEAAIAREPDRIELKSKLLEIYFAWGNTSKFSNALSKYRRELEADEDEWEKIEAFRSSLNDNA